MLLRATFTVSALFGIAHAVVAGYGQCGGDYYTGDTVCTNGWKCTVMNQCEWLVHRAFTILN